jgi:hypothetical protein
MSRRRPSARWTCRWTAHAVVFVLLLKAAVPLLASVAADLQGKGVAEICDVYGVALPSHTPMSAGAHAHHHHAHHGAGGDPTAPSPSGLHRGDHCALTALSVFAPPDATALAVAPPRAVEATALPGAVAVAHGPDAAARWAARLEHAPPAFA